MDSKKKLIILQVIYVVLLIMSQKFMYFCCPQLVVSVWYVEISRHMCNAQIAVYRLYG